MTPGMSLATIRTDGGTQSRAELSAETIAEYRDAMAAGAAFPPVVVFHDGTTYWLADGFHRVEAARTSGATEIAADVRQGTRRAAVLFSAGANAAHGLRRTNADKRRAVETLLRDEEWSAWSDREIARRCGVSQTFVGSVRASLSDNGCQIDARPVKVERNGIVYEQKPRAAPAGEETVSAPAGRPTSPPPDAPTTSPPADAPTSPLPPDAPASPPPARGADGDGGQPAGGSSGGAEAPRRFSIGPSVPVGDLAAAIVERYARGDVARIINELRRRVFVGPALGGSL